MGYSDNSDNTNLYSAPSSPGEFDAYPFPSQASIIEEVNGSLSTFTGGCSMGKKPGHVAGSQRALRAEASFETVTSVTSYDARAHSDVKLTFPRNHWPVTGRYAQSHDSGIVSRDTSFTSTVALEASTIVPIPSSVPLEHLGDNESGPSTNTSYGINIQTPHQHSTGSTRTVIMPTWRFQPYGTPSARLNEHTNANAGPSTLKPPLAPCVAPLITHPSEATTDAEQDRGIAKEDTALTVKPPGQPREGRDRYRENIRELRVWAEGCSKDHAKLPSHEKALRTALEVIKTNRAPMYPSKLAKGASMRTKQGKRAADAEYRRRTAIRELNEELSKYYELEEDQAAWGCPQLLLKVLCDVHGKPPVNPSS